MNKKWLLHFIAVGALVMFVILGVASATRPAADDTSNAVVPSGLSIDPDNYAYIRGGIIAVDQHRVIGQSALGGLAERTVNIIKVPAGRELTVLVPLGTTWNILQPERKTYHFDVNQNISLPPLENGKIYRLRVTETELDRERILYISCNVSLQNITDNTYLFSRRIYFNPPIRPRQ